MLLNSLSILALAPFSARCVLTITAGSLNQVWVSVADSFVTPIRLHRCCFAITTTCPLGGITYNPAPFSQCTLAKSCQTGTSDSIVNYYRVVAHAMHVTVLQIRDTPINKINSALKVLSDL